MDWGPLLQSLGEGTVVTLLVSAAGIAAGMVFGLALALARRASSLLSWPIAIYVSLLRATPVVTLALLVFFALPGLGLALPPIAAAILTLTLNTSAFQAEIWRASFAAFPEGQRDAARAAGMTSSLAFRRVVFPQVWRASLPALVNEATLLLKGSPAVAVIGVVDLTRAAVRATTVDYNPLRPFLAATAIYVLVVLSLIAVQRGIERRIVRKYGVL